MKNNNPPYLFGLLCLIPLIGAFVGLGLILYGIFRYKDSKLIILGSMGLMITIVVYSLVFNDLKHGKSTANNFAKISKIQLNGLVKSIEFYKLQNGVYPDSLEQINATDKTALIYDPSLIKKWIIL